MVQKHRAIGIALTICVVSCCIEMLPSALASSGQSPRHAIHSHCVPEPHINLAGNPKTHKRRPRARRVCLPDDNPSLRTGAPQLGGGYPNARIAEVGLSRVGQYGGQCKEAVNIWVAIASNGAQHLGGNYLANYRAQGGTEVGRDQSVEGDIIQLNGPNGNYYYEGMHTAVVVSHTPGSNNFVVVDSNFNWHETVSKHEWNPYTAAAAHGLTVHIWRMGSAGSPPSSSPEPPAPQGPGTSRGNPNPPDEGFWRLRNSASPGDPEDLYSYGGHASIPIVGDWTGSGVDMLGVFTQEPAGDRWQLRTEPGPGPAQIEFHYGGPTDLPVVGDWTGSGKDGIGVFTPGTALWRLRNTATPGNPEIEYQYGGAYDEPVVGDWGGVHHDGTGVFTPPH